MKIALLAWGSLIYDTTGVSLKTGWKHSGAVLPLEFSRVSSSGERKGVLTLVIDPNNGYRQPSFCAESSHTNLSDAITELAIREKVSQRISIGYINLKSEAINSLAYELYPNTCQRIGDWAYENDFEGVIWTGFRANFEKMTDEKFTLQNALEYIKNLPKDIQVKAFDYFDKAPKEIQTPLRTYLNEYRQFGKK